MAEALAFVETTRQWDVLTRVRRERGLEVSIIAITPEVDWCAERDGVAVETVERLVPEADLVARGDENLARLAAFCDDADRLLREEARGLEREEWVSLRLFYHGLKGLVDSLTVRGLPVEAALSAHPGARVLTFDPPRYTLAGSAVFDKPPYFLTTRIVPLAAAAHGLETEPLDAGAGADSPSASRALLTAVGRRAAYARGLALDVRAAVRGALRRRRLPPDQPLLITSIFEDLGSDILERWNALGGAVLPYQDVFPRRPAPLAGRRARAAALRFWRRLSVDERARRYFVVGRTDLFPLARPLLERICTEDVARLLAFGTGAERALERWRRAIVLTGGMVDSNAVIGRAAEVHRTPVVSIHYGGFLGYSRLPIHERYDMAFADWFVCGGEGGARTFEQPGPRVVWWPNERRARPVAIGAPWIERLVRSARAAPFDTAADRPSPSRRRLMYVISAFVGDNRYLGRVYWPEIAFWRLQRRLVEVVAARPDVHLLLKPPLIGRYPQLVNPLFDWLAGQRFSNVEVMRDVPLKDALDEADAFLVDSPSTPLLHVVATDKPFLAYCDRAVFDVIPEAAELLRRRARYADTYDGFFAELGGLLDDPDWSRRAVDDGFLLSYGIHAADGGSAERCAQFLHSLARGSFDITRASTESTRRRG